MMPELYTVADLAAILKAEEDTIRKWTLRGALDWALPSKTPGGQWRYSRQAVDERYAMHEAQG